MLLAEGLVLVIVCCYMLIVGVMHCYIHAVHHSARLPVLNVFCAKHLGRQQVPARAVR